MKIAERASIYIKQILTSLFWGGSFIAGRYLAHHMPHFCAATGRFIAAFLALFLIMKLQRKHLSPLTAKQFIATVGLAGSGVLAYNYFFFAGLEKIAASRAALIMALGPLVILFSVQLIERTKWTRQQIGGIALSTLGAIIVINGGLPGSSNGHWIDLKMGVGEFLILGAVLSWTAYTVIARYCVADLDSLSMTTYAVLWGIFMLAVPAAWEVQAGLLKPLHGSAWVAMAYMGICASALAFVWYTEGVAKIGAARTGLFTNLVPVFGVLLSVIFLREEIPLSGIGGGALVIFGIVLINQSQKAK